MDNRRISKDWYLQCLRVDPLSYDAFHHLTSSQTLTIQEEKELIEEIRGVQGWETVPWIMDFYECVSNKFDLSKSKEVLVIPFDDLKLSLFIVSLPLTPSNHPTFTHPNPYIRSHTQKEFESV